MVAKRNLGKVQSQVAVNFILSFPRRIWAKYVFLRSGKLLVVENIMFYLFINNEC